MPPGPTPRPQRKSPYVGLEESVRRVAFAKSKAHVDPGHWVQRRAAQAPVCPFQSIREVGYASSLSVGAHQPTETALCDFIVCIMLTIAGHGEFSKPLVVGGALLLEVLSPADVREVQSVVSTIAESAPRNVP